MQALAEQPAVIAEETTTADVGPLAADPASPINVRLRAILFEAEDIALFEFVDPARKALPPFKAGAHIDVHVRRGCVRQYSLCNDPVEGTRYVVAVQREETGRGGSRAMHDELRVGAMVSISPPRNFFPLVRGATRHLLLGGGIGVTPMIAMVAELEARGEPYHLHYCTRSAEKTAFMERLAPLITAGQVSLHHDGGVPSQGLDVVALLHDYDPGTHLYYCGPAGFMAAIKAASDHWPKGTVHFEYFSPPAEPATEAVEDQPFRVKLARSGLDLEVPQGKTIVDVLRENDVFIETSCQEGYCGTCLTRCLAGEPDHRDSVLDEDDRKEFIMVCCSRSKTPVLTLDL
jgi:ferredoxin-NADP reductase